MADMQELLKQAEEGLSNVPVEEPKTEEVPVEVEKEAGAEESVVEIDLSDPVVQMGVAAFFKQAGLAPEQQQAVIDRIQSGVVELERPMEDLIADPELIDAIAQA